MNVDSRQVLWKNVYALMMQRYGRENIAKLANDTNLSTATIYRIKEMTTSIGVTVLDSIARGMGVTSMQLLDPEFDPYKATKATGSEFSPLATDLASQLDSMGEPLKRERAYVLATQALVAAANAGIEKMPLRAIQPMRAPVLSR